MSKWNKLGKVFNPRRIQGRSWLGEFAQAPCTLVFEDFVRVYFSCRPPPDENGQYRSYSAFVDLERNDLFQIVRVGAEPILPLGGPANSTGSGPIPSR